MNKVSKALLKISEPIFLNCLHGLEREALRIDHRAFLALSPHPSSLAFPLTHPKISTDFSESQIEFIMPPYESLNQLCEELEKICFHVRSELNKEYLWAFSMPSLLPSNENQIPIARYGNSKIAKKKEIYRKGLRLRYGARMQTISGVHYNFSFQPTFWKAYFRERNETYNSSSVSEAYLGIIRNCLRYSYIFPYLFGASPAFDTSFLSPASEDQKNSQYHSKQYFQERKQILQRLKNFQKDQRTRTLYKEYATSLRLSEIGYNHPLQWKLKISYNSLPEYIETMRNALTMQPSENEKRTFQPHEQLSSAPLQSENEYYALIRPKQHELQGLSLLDALSQKGISYLELRAFDIDPFSCCGTDLKSFLFTHLFLIYCLFHSSPFMNSDESLQILDNFLTVVWDGRNLNCKILPLLGEKQNGTKRLWEEDINQKKKSINPKAVSLRENGLSLCKKLKPIAERLDWENQNYRRQKSNLYMDSLSSQEEKFRDPKNLLSSRILDEMNQKKQGFIELGLSLSKEHLEKETKLTEKDIQKFSQMRELSIREYKKIEQEI